MSISVVTVRDYEGVPSTRELYARGVRYVINSGGDLEVLGDGRPGGPLGYYPSGNWMSVFVDDPVRVLVKGEQDTSVIGGPAPAAVDTDTPVDLDTETPVDLDTEVEVDAEADTTAEAFGSDEDHPADIDLEPVSVVDEPDAPIYRQVADDLAAAAAASATAEPAPDAEFGAEFHTDFDPETSAKPPAAQKPKPDRGTIPAGMQPVKFGPRIIRPPKPKVTPDPTRHMMPVTFRSRPLRAGLARPTPAPTEEQRPDEPGGDEG